MSYDGNYEELRKPQLKTMLFNWIEDWLGIIDCLCGVLTFTTWYPQLAYRWRYRDLTTKGG